LEQANSQFIIDGHVSRKAEVKEKKDEPTMSQPFTGAVKQVAPTGDELCPKPGAHGQYQNTIGAGNNFLVTVEASQWPEISLKA
jgi:hypothetical protein